MIEPTKRATKNPPKERGTKRRKEMLKAEMMGIDKVVGQIRKMRRENEGRNTM